MRTIYLIGQRDNFDVPIKIGVATNVQERLRTIQTGCPYPLEVLLTFPGDLEHESYLHNIYADKRTSGEWFLLTEEDFKLIKAAAVLYQQGVVTVEPAFRPYPTAGQAFSLLFKLIFYSFLLLCVLVTIGVMIG